MNIKDLINKLGDYPYDTQVFIASDAEVNGIHEIDTLDEIVLKKQNNSGGFDALIIVPSSFEREEYSDEDKE